MKINDMQQKKIIVFDFSNFGRKSRKIALRYFAIKCFYDSGVNSHLQKHYYFPLIGLN